MIKLTLQRILSMVPILLVVSFVSFLLVALAPGNPAVILAGPNASNDQIAAISAQLHLDDPLVTRFLGYLGQVVRLDLGKSLFSGTPVWESIGAAVPVTASIGLVAFVLSVLISVPAGVVAAIRRNGIVDRGVTAVSSFFLGIPPFVFALLLVLLLCIRYPLLPSSDFAPLADGFWPWLSHLLLPGLALAFPFAAEVTRQLRGALVDVLEQDYIRTQRAKGLPSWLVVGKHAMKNAAPPAITVLGLQMARFLGGAVIVEQVFAMPGFGSLALQAVQSHDYPLIQGVVLVSAVVVVVTSLFTDLLEMFLNPRLQGAKA